MISTIVFICQSCIHTNILKESEQAEHPKPNSCHWLICHDNDIYIFNSVCYFDLHTLYNNINICDFLFLSIVHHKAQIWKESTWRNNNGCSLQDVEYIIRINNNERTELYLQICAHYNESCWYLIWIYCEHRRLWWRCKLTRNHGNTFIDPSLFSLR